MTEIFNFCPSEKNFKDGRWRTLVTKFEVAEQRRNIVSGPKASWVFRWKQALLTRTLMEEIWAFFNARKGMGETFYLRSFYEETKFNASYTTGTSLTVLDSSKFTKHWNNKRKLIYCENSSGEKEVAEMSVTPPDSTHISIAQELTYDYQVGDIIEICFLVRFDVDEISFEELKYYLIELGLPMMEPR